MDMAAIAGDPDGPGDRWRFGAADFDAATGRLVVAGRPVELDRPCRALLAALLARAGQPLGRGELLAAGWPGRTVHDSSLAQAISRLRRALGEEGARIEAVYGSGYRLKGPVVRREPRDEAARRWWPARFGGRGRGARWAAMAVSLALLAIVVAALLFAHEARERAAEEARQKEALVAFLSADLLAAGDGDADADRDLSLHQAVERAAATMNTELRDDPATRVAVHRMIASAYAGWGEYEKAVLHLDRARTLAEQLYGEGTPRTLPIDIGLCSNLRRSGDLRLAEPVCARAERAARGGDARAEAVAQLAHAKLLVEIGDDARAAALLDRVAAHSTPLTAGERADVEWFSARAQARLAHFARADAAFRRNLSQREALYGGPHALIARAHSDYGAYLATIGDFAAAERELAEAERLFGATLAADHVDALAPAHGRALIALARGEAARARDLLRPILARFRARFGDDRLPTLDVITELALAEAGAGDAERAAALLREARQSGARLLYRREAHAADFHLRWARTLAALGEPAEAERERRRAAQAMDRSGVAADHPWRARLHCLAARIARARGEAAASRQEGAACLSALRAIADLPPTYPALAEAEQLARGAPDATR